MRHLAFTTWTVLLCASFAGAQPASRKDPAQYVGTERASRVEARAPGVRLGLRKPREFALAPLSDSQLAEFTRPGPRLKTGLHRDLPPEVLGTGAWEATSEGTRVWRMAIHSPGSAGIRVEFREFSVGSGKVWLHDGSESAGPYTGRGIFDDGRFWSATVFTDTAILEYEPAPDQPGDGAPPFLVRAIAHTARRAPGGSARTLQAPAAGTPTTDPAAACHLDPNCYSEWKGAMRMVAQITFEDGGEQYMCSGTLISTRDNSFKPYFLTAGHCIHSEDAARSLETYWTFQTSSCGGAPPARASSSKSTLGAHLVDYGTVPEGDYSLVLLKDVPSGVTFAGWDLSDPPLTAQVAGMHHPMGSWKRISFGERVADETVVVEDQLAPAGKYLQIYEEKGRTEPGSSGSAIFTSPGGIVGTLTYGAFSPTISVCDIEPSVDGYGRFSAAYPALRDYLENFPSSIVTPDKSTLSYSVAGRTAPAGQVVRLTTQSPGQIAYKLRPDAPWIQLSATNGTVSAGAPAQVTVSVDPAKFDRTDKYAGTVTILAGAADPRFVNVNATVTLGQSDVTASVSPNQVTQAGGQWSFKIRLAESAGVATRLTAVKINGTDYSSSIKGWFGTDRIDAKGAIEAPLQGAGRFPAGSQYLEFWGADETGGQPWYRVATVVFQ